MKVKYKFWKTENLTVLLIASQRNKGKKLTVFDWFGFVVSFLKRISVSSFAKPGCKDVSDTLAERNVLNDVSVVVQIFFPSVRNSFCFKWLTLWLSTKYSAVFFPHGINLVFLSFFSKNLTESFLFHSSFLNNGN